MKIQTKVGRVSVYGLACGYIEEKQIGTFHITLWLEGNCTHVRSFNTENGNRIWDSFDDYHKIVKARKRFDELCASAFS